MRTSTLLRALASLAVGLLVVELPSFGAETICPAAGTIVITRWWGTVDHTATWRGSDSKDPFVCLGTSHLGVDFRQIPGGYPVNVRRGREAIESGMNAVLNNGAAEVSFNWSWVLIGYWRGDSIEDTVHDKWTRLGTEVFSINGRPVSVIRFRRNSESLHGNFAGQWDLLYDPLKHLFVRSVYSAIRGNNKGSWEVISVSP